MKSRNLNEALKNFGADLTSINVEIDPYDNNFVYSKYDVSFSCHDPCIEAITTALQEYEQHTEELKLHEKYPALKDAYEQYQFLLKMYKPT